MQSKLTHRNAFTLTELVVAAALMVSVMAVIAPLTVHSARLLQDTRHQQLVMDELSNELERLTMLAPDERDKAIAELVPSEHVRWMLPSAEITAETVRDEDGVRLVLSLNWDRPGRPRPITFVGWLDSSPSEANASWNRKSGVSFQLAGSWSSQAGSLRHSTSLPPGPSC
jgi:type II secretory pathway pseudopilin PulG